MTMAKTPVVTRPWSELRATSAESFRQVLLAELDRQIAVVSAAAAHASIQRDAARIAGELGALHAMRGIVAGADLGASAPNTEPTP